MDQEQCNRCLAGTMVEKSRKRRKGGGTLVTRECDKCGRSDERELPAAAAKQPKKK